MAETKQCSATGKFKPTIRDFYSTQSMLYEYDKKLPMSKEVVDKYFKKLIKNYDNINVFLRQGKLKIISNKKYLA